MVGQKCFNTFKLIIDTHLPCHKIVRKNYVDFFTKPFIKKINSEETSIKPDNVFEFVLDSIWTEFQPHSPSGPITQVPKCHDLSEKDISINEGCLLKKNRESYNAMDRNERLRRLFLILNMLVTLLESDLAIWITK